MIKGSTALLESTREDLKTSVYNSGVFRWGFA